MTCVTAQEVLDKIALNNCVRLLRTCLKTGAILNVKVLVESFKRNRRIAGYKTVLSAIFGKCHKNTA